jgi:hypothetical protein
MPSRLIDIDSTFFLGCDSSKDPRQTRLGGYWHGINTVNVGGMISCRPGYKCIVQLPSGKLQGTAIFRPALGLEQLLVGIDGAIYVAEFPFKSFRLLTNVQMLPYAKQLFFQQATQTAERRTQDLNSAIDVVAPREVIFIQDGGYTAPAFYDGSQSGHIRDNLFETPSGGPMAWVGDRLWVAVGNNVFASDISNPFSFREQQYPGGSTGLTFSGEVTAMIKIPSIEFPQLIVFTESDVSLVQADIRDRSLWLTTDGFQREIAQVGCPSHRSLVSHFGRLSWMSSSGVAIFDASTLGKVASRLPIRDNELMTSKTVLADDLSLCASCAFGQFLLFSVPAEDIYNKHTWALNNASLETLNDDSGPSWMGLWMGTRPVEWVFGQIAGRERAYHISYDEDGVNRLWEAFREERLDNGCPIMWAFFTRNYFGPTGVSGKPPVSPCTMQFADIALAGIEEDLDMGVFYAGGLRGAFKTILAKRINVERGSLSFDQQITATTQLFGFKPQSRTERTEDARLQPTEGVDTGSCPPESAKLENEDDSFQLLVVFHGPAAVNFIRVFSLQEINDLSGEPEACENQLPFNSVRFDGAGISTSDLAASIQDLASRPVRRFTANKTVMVEQLGYSAVGVGSSESVVSQDAADRVAEIIATKQAEAELAGVTPPTFSIGAT